MCLRFQAFSEICTLCLCLISHQSGKKDYLAVIFKTVNKFFLSLSVYFSMSLSSWWSCHVSSSSDQFEKEQIAQTAFDPPPPLPCQAVLGPIYNIAK